MSVQDMANFVRQTFLWAHVERRASAKKNWRICKLRGDDNPRQAVINAATLELMLPNSYWAENPDPASTERDDLIDRELDNAKYHYVRETEKVSRPGPIKKYKKPPKMFDLERFSETGDALASEPTRELEKIDAASNAIEQEKMAAAWEAKLKREIDEFTKRVRNPKHRRAWKMISADQTLRDYQIAKRCKVAPDTVSKLRDQLEVLQAQHTPNMTAAPEAEIATATLQEDAELTQIADASEVDVTEATVHSDALERAATLQAPDVDADISESTLTNYARKQRSASAFNAPHCRQYSDHTLITGIENRRYTSEDRVFEERKRRLKKLKREPISEAVQELAEKFGIALDLLHSASIRDALMQAEIDRLTGELYAERLTAQSVGAFVSKAEPLCEPLSMDTDELLSSVIANHPERPSLSLLYLFKLFCEPEEDDAPPST